MARFLLVHGSCHGAWCWERLIAPLEALGHEVRAMDLPGAGQDGTDRATVTLGLYAGAVLAALQEFGPALVVGHSMGGYPITAAAEQDPRLIQALIYLCAYRPVSGCSLAQMRRRGPRQPLQGALLVQDGAFLFDPERAADLLYHDCPPEVAERALSLLTPQPVAPQEEPLVLSAQSQDLPQYYIHCAQDRVIPPDYQLTMAAGLPPGHLRHLPSAHSPFYAMPDRLAAELSEIAQDLLRS